MRRVTVFLKDNSQFTFDNCIPKETFSKNGNLTITNQQTENVRRTTYFPESEVKYYREDNITFGG